VAVGVGAPVELDGDPVFEGVRRFPELLPFLGFREPEFHFSLRNQSPLTAHAFLRGKLIRCPHDASPLTADHAASGERKLAVKPINVPDFVINNLILSLLRRHTIIGDDRV
jgi:hypothetical protein